MNPSIIEEISSVKAQEGFDTLKSASRAKFGVMATQQRQPDSPVARRMRSLRIALEGDDHGSQARMAARLGISLGLWNNAERGLKVSSRLEDIIMDRVPGMSLDWLRRGHIDGLSTKMSQLLGEVVLKGRISQS